jgi:hypothetical protein
MRLRCSHRYPASQNLKLGNWAEQLLIAGLGYLDKRGTFASLKNDVFGASIHFTIQEPRLYAIVA